MSLLYKLFYQVGFTPWEEGALEGPAAKQIADLFEREERERNAPFGRVLDLGCGSGIWSVNLAQRGWDVTGVDVVPKAVRRAEQRAKEAGVTARFIQGDVTALKPAEIGSGFNFLIDFECFNHLNATQRAAVGRGVNAVSAPNATLLMLTWAPAKRLLLPPGAGHGEIEAAFPGWRIIDEEAYDKSALPPSLKDVDPTFYRLRRG